MRTAYKVLAYLVALEVVVQAMVMVWAVAGLGKWIASGGVLDKSLMESGSSVFPEDLGFLLHGVNGMFVVPLVALVLLAVSYLTKTAGASKWAGIVFALTVVQGQLGLLGHDIPAVGAVHGLNALLLFLAALHTARRFRPAARRLAEPETRATAPVSGAP